MSLQQDQASSLEVAIKNLREAAKGYRRGNERQKSALDEKKRSKVEMEQEQTTLIKETLSINREIDEVERQIVTLKRSSSKNSQEIENAEAKNLKLRNSVISKKRELDKEARRHGAVDNDKFDKSAFDEKERQVKSILNKPTTNTTTVQTNAGRPAKLQNQWDSAVESRYPKPAPFLNDSSHFGSSLQPSTLQANPKPLEAIATDLTMDNGSTAHESNPTPSMASQTGSKVSPISVPSKLGTNYIDSNNAIFFPGDSTKSSGFMMDPVSPDMMEIPRKKKPNRPNPLHIPDDIMSVKAPFKSPRTPQEKKVISERGKDLIRLSNEWGCGDGPVIKWQKGHQIGQGGNARVFVGMDMQTGAKIAVKELDMWNLGLEANDDNSNNFSGAQSQESSLGAPPSAKPIVGSKSNSKMALLRREITIMKKLAHKNIVRYLGTDIREVNGRAQMYILLEYVPGGSLRKMYREWGPLNTPIIREYSRQILNGLVYLHNYTTPGEMKGKEGIIHRDIKCANILINDNGIVKLADFGCSQVFQGEESLKANSNSAMLGSIPWMAPEAINHAHEHVGRKSDIWSFGCTIVEMATAQHPWPNSDNVYSILYKVASTDAIPEMPESLTAMGIDFLKHCFRRNPKARWSSAHLLEHPFVAMSMEDTKMQPPQER